METAYQVVHYLPILTTLMSAVFAVSILRRYAPAVGNIHLLWWGMGVAIYGLGTLMESLYTLFGYSELVFKSWYIAGALLGGAPLAIGTAYLLFGKRTGHFSAASLIVLVTITSFFVIQSPIRMNLIANSTPNGSLLEWQSIRLVSPIVNSWAAIVLIGGAFYSASQYRKRPETRNRFIGNIYIAIGAILPGVGGGLSRAGYTEALYIGELLGLILIWVGYNYCRRQPGLVSNSDTTNYEKIPLAEENG
ncbi:MAG: hypothetical protein P1R58_01275 [bacterium]|nr:hypothetical protein [bacterium]